MEGPHLRASSFARIMNRMATHLGSYEDPNIPPNANPDQPENPNPLMRIAAGMYLIFAEADARAQAALLPGEEVDEEHMNRQLWSIFEEMKAENDRLDAEVNEEKEEIAGEELRGLLFDDLQRNYERWEFLRTQELNARRAARAQLTPKFGEPVRHIPPQEEEKEEKDEAEEIANNDPQFYWNYANDIAHIVS